MKMATVSRAAIVARKPLWSVVAAGEVYEFQEKIRDLDLGSF